jgi:hypothetical protein
MEDIRPKTLMAYALIFAKPTQPMACAHIHRSFSLSGKTSLLKKTDY